MLKKNHGGTPVSRWTPLALAVAAALAGQAQAQAQAQPAAAPADGAAPWADGVALLPESPMLKPPLQAVSDASAAAARTAPAAVRVRRRLDGVMARAPSGGSSGR